MQNSPILPADPRCEYLLNKEAIDRAVDDALLSGRYILGPQVEAFENAFAEYHGVASAIGVASGTDALQVALRAAGVGPGDAVLTVSHTAVATVAAIELAGARPLMVDIDPESYTMDPAALQAILEEWHEDATILAGCTPRAVVPVHLYGHPADMVAIKALADDWGLVVVEDCAQAHGARIDGVKVGTMGDIGIFSFYPTKNLGAMGDGGALICKDPQLAETIRLMRQYGWQQRYVSDVAGMNSRLDEVQAAILNVKLLKLDAFNERRREIARQYSRALASSAYRVPDAAPGIAHVYHQYVIRTTRRDELREYLNAQGIGTLVHYPVPVHLQPAYKGRDLTVGRQLPVTEQVCKEILSLPMHPGLSDDDVQRIVKHLKEWNAGKTA
ncbi:MAG: DegT/DnrJ/EryC1/StrS family aminotransferase [Candidatus Pacebacteria bacterium]|nr:DegT/DnrJ/EryC1/StrS family aminotransferase [Candidatus Paceibacterota bacterium]